MKLILSRFDPIKKINIIYSIPDQGISDEIQDSLKKIYDKFKDKEISDKFYDFESYLSYLIKVESAWYPGTNEVLVLTLYVEEHENTHLFKEVMKQCISDLKNIPRLSKALYVNTPHTDTEAFNTFGKVIQVLTSCFFEVSKIHSTYNLGIAEILVLGSKGSGKTSIIDYLLHHKPMPQSVPTLTPKIYKLIYENIDFRVLDVCCKTHVKEVFEDHPIEPGKLPQAIIYVVDVSLEGEAEVECKKEFTYWIEFLAKQYPSDVFEQIPILILFNKTDLNPLFNEVEYEEQYGIENRNLNLHYETVSAITGEGLDDSLSWAIKRIKITEKY